MTNGQRACALVIDDEPDIVDTLEEVLSQAGFEVAKATSGLDGLSIAKKRHLDVVITDLKMPGMSGLETLAEVKRIAPSMPVIVISGFASDGTVEQCEGVGAFALLMKPFKLDELLRVVNGAVRQSAASAR